MKNIIAVFLLSELKGGGDGVNLAFEYTDGSALPKLGNTFTLDHQKLNFKYQPENIYFRMMKQ